jgi:TolA-binding protein
MGRGWVLYRKGQLDKAAEVFMGVANAKPNHPLAEVARYNAGSALFNLGRFADALPLFDALAAGKGEQAAPSVYWKGMCLLKLGRAADSMAPLQQAAAAGPYQAKASFAVGDAQLALKDPAKAQAAYAAVADRFPKDELADDALQAAAAVAAERGAPEEAAALAQRLIQTYPDSALAGDAKFLVGEALFRKEAFKEAADQFRALLDAPPKSIGRDVLLYKLAWCAYRRQEAEAALDLFQRVAREEPKSKLAGESLYMAGKIETDRNRHAEARALYEKSLKDYPDSPAAENAAYAKGLAEFSAKDWGAAAASLDAYLKAHPTGKLASEALFYGGEARFALKDYDGAARAYEGCLKAAPQGQYAAQAGYGAAWCAKEKGQTEAAAAAFEQVAAAHPQSETAAKALYWAARCRMDAGKPAEAAALLEKAAAAPGAQAVAEDAAYYAANCLLLQKNYDKAIEAYGQFVTKFPQSGRRANALYDTAWAWQGKDDQAKAADLFRQVAAATEDNRLKTDSLFRLAEYDYAREKYAEAEALYKQVEALPAVAFLDKVHYKLGWALEKQGKWAEAQAAYAKVPIESEMGADAAFRAARMLQEQGKQQEAEAALAALLARQGLSADATSKARFQRAEALRALKRWADALKAYGELAAAGGFDPAYHVQYGLGVCSLELNAYADAQQAFQRVIEMTETETAARAQLGLAEVLYRQGRFDEAARESLKVHYLYGYPKWKAQGLLRAAQSFEKAGQKERASRYLQELAEKFPDSEAAAEAKAPATP